VQALNVVLRVAMELGIIVALVYWGAKSGVGTAASVLLAIVAPLVGFGLWSAVDFRRLGALAEPLRLAEELLICGLAVLAAYVAGAHALGWALALLSIVHHTLVYLAGDRLLTDRTATRSRRSTHARAGGMF
jgi:hypothetical protein